MDLDKHQLSKKVEFYLNDIINQNYIQNKEIKFPDKQGSALITTKQNKEGISD